MTLPPGPNRFAWLQFRGWISDPLTLMKELSARYGDIFTVRIPGGRNYVVISHPTHIREVFQKDSEHFFMEELNTALKPVVGRHSLFVMDGSQHQRARRMIMPSFHGDRMHEYGAQMIGITQHSLDRWTQKVTFSTYEFARELALDIILVIIFGADTPEKFNKLKSLVTEELDTLGKWPWLLFSFTQLNLGPISPWGIFLKKAKKVDEFLYQEIRERRTSRIQGRHDILSLLLEAHDGEGNPISDEEIHDHLITLLLAGHETTAASLTWAFRWILNDPHLLNRLQAEVASTLEEGKINHTKVEELKLLDATIREVLRILPVVPALGRLLKKPITLGEFTIPEGTGIVPAIYLTHLKESVFPNADSFQPDRFLNSKVLPFQWLPFGGGTRRCIGFHFAIYELKMILATALVHSNLSIMPMQNFTPLRRGMTMIPFDGVRIETRKSA